MLVGERRPMRKLAAGTRFHSVAALLGKTHHGLPTIGHARVSSSDRKAEPDRQPAGGLHCRKPGLQCLLEFILRQRMPGLVPTRKNCLLRFGSELVFILCAQQGSEGILIYQAAVPLSFEEEWAKDMLEIITVFPARRYGCRSHRSRTWPDAWQAGAIEASSSTWSVL